MHLIEGINYRGLPLFIPQCSRQELPGFFKQLGFQKGAEIGVYKGKFCEKFCQMGLTMYAIDSWRDLDQSRQDYLYEYTKKVLLRFHSCNVLRQSSMEAAKQFTPNSLDFVYIDADHSLGGINQDIHIWYEIVRRGGIVSGHDYAYTGTDPRAMSAFAQSCQVPRAVDTFVKNFGIQNLYTFGRSKPIDLESKNDRYLSWMFFKP